MKTTNLTNIKPFPKLEPETDSNLIKLFKLSLAGKLPTYFANIPVHLIQPFDHDFHPQDQPLVGEVIDDLKFEIEHHEVYPVWVYPNEGMFILSDDYLAYQAYLATKAEFLPCFILGDPKAHTSFNMAGPLSQEQVMIAAGIIL